MALQGSDFCLCSRPLSSTNEQGLKPDAPGHNRPPLTYKEAGVDIDAGDALVDHIKPLARSTNRRGVIGGLGGFGGLFDLKAAGFSDPILEIERKRIWARVQGFCQAAQAISRDEELATRGCHKRRIMGSM